MKNLIKNLLRENLQQADKFYFNSGKLSNKAKEIIVRITNGDSYTKLISDMYFATLEANHDSGQWAISAIDPSHKKERRVNDVLDNKSLDELKVYHNDLLSYNKNVFPINGLNINGVDNIHYLMSALKQRRLILNMFSQLPSIASRNMKAEIRQVRTYPELQEYRSDMEYFMAYYSQLSNRDDAAKAKIEAKMFKNGTTLEELLRFAEEKENLVGGVNFSKKKVKEIVKEDGYDLDIIHEKGDVMVIEVSGPNGIKKIGCNSLWCFTYGSGFDNAWRQWNDYSTNGLVYVIIDFSVSPDSKDFMHVLIKPLQDEYDEDEDENPSTLFDMSNEPQYHPNHLISNLMDFKTAKKIMNFGEEHIEPKVLTKKEPFKDPNQLAFAFESRRFIKNKLYEELMGEDYPSSFDMEHFKTLRRYSERVRYCEQHLTKISSGSARIVYMIDNEKVLKLAKNEKGIAQCEVEIQWGNDSYFGGILARTIDSHPDGFWVEMQLAKKAKKSDFQQLEGFWFDKLGIHLKNWNARIKGKRPLFFEDEKLKNQMDENEWISELKELSQAMETGVGDFDRLSTYGIVKKDGQDSIVVIDFGLTGDVYDTYYS